MKSKWIIFGILLAVGMVIWSPQSSYAATTATCQILQVSQDMGASTVTLKEVNGVFTTTFTLYTASAKQMLAIALTAASLGKNVTVRIQNDGLTVDRIRMNPMD